MALPDDLKMWVAENVMLGSDLESLKATLVQMGFMPSDVNAAVEDARTHPYTAAGLKLGLMLRKREALLKTLDQQLRHFPAYQTLTKEKLPPFKEFLQRYYYSNLPGLFTGGIDHWPARQWTPRALVEKVGPDAMVQIQYDREKDAQYESNSHHLRRDIRFGAFIDMVESTESNNFYLTANNAAFMNGTLKVLLDDMGNVGDNYLHPEQLGQATHLWIGPKGTVTPLHHDLTNNLFIQVYGKKKFTLIPSYQVPYMYNYLHVFSEVDLLQADVQRFPDFAKITPIVFEVEAGDILFIPIGWWHHVVGLTPNISLSFTNFNLPFNGFTDYPQGARY